MLHPLSSDLVLFLKHSRPFRTVCSVFRLLPVYPTVLVLFDRFAPCFSNSLGGLLPDPQTLHSFSSRLLAVSQIPVIFERFALCFSTTLVLFEPCALCSLVLLVPSERSAHCFSNTLVLFEHFAPCVSNTRLPLERCACCFSNTLTLRCAACF